MSPAAITTKLWLDAGSVVICNGGDGFEVPPSLNARTLYEYVVSGCTVASL